MTHEGGATLVLVSDHAASDQKVLIEEDPFKLTKHHRKPQRQGVDNSPRNISHIPLFKHRAWHILHQDRPAEEIIPQFQLDYEIFGTDYPKSDLFTDYCQKVANSNRERIKRQEAWHILYKDMTLAEMIELTNAEYLDPDYEIVIRTRRILVPELKCLKGVPTRYAYS